MKLLAISDYFIPQRMMQRGLSSLGRHGVSIDVIPWEHKTSEDIHAANLMVKQNGPAVHEVPESIMLEIGKYDILIVHLAPVAEKLLEKAKKLKIVGVLRSGWENVDLKAVTERGISVFNTPGRNARAIAEYTLGLILSEMRNIARGHAAMKQGIWQRDFVNSHSIPEMNGKTVGLIGYGAVGRLLAVFLDALGANVIAFDPFAKGDTSPARLMDLETVLRESDIISLHTRYVRETHHLIGMEELAMMKSTAILINTSNGGLIDEKALFNALCEGRIMGAALDVFTEEPLSFDHPLMGLENVTLTPRLALCTDDVFANTPIQMAEQLTRWLSGEENHPVINGIFPEAPNLARS